MCCGERDGTEQEKKQYTVCTAKASHDVTARKLRPSLALHTDVGHTRSPQQMVAASTIIIGGLSREYEKSCLRMRTMRTYPKIDFRVKLLLKINSQLNFCNF